MNKRKEIYYQRRRQVFYIRKEGEKFFLKIKTQIILCFIAFLSMMLFMILGNFFHATLQKISSENILKDVSLFSYEHEFFKIYHSLKVEKKQENAKKEDSENIFSMKTLWPLRDASGRALYSVRREIDIPDKDWNPGHRGLDLQILPHSQIVAPFDGTIRFVGVIAGRNILSVENIHGVVMSFEPCISHREKGHSIKKGDFLGIVAGMSLDGNNNILHLGAKINKNYIDPRQILLYKNIGLKTSLEFTKV